MCQYKDLRRVLQGFRSSETPSQAPEKPFNLKDDARISYLVRDRMLLNFGVLDIGASELNCIMVARFST